MTPMERLGALMRGALPDRVPIICNMMEQGATELGMNVREYYSSPEHVVDGQIKLQKRYGYDNVWGYFSTAREVELLGCTNLVWSNEGPPNVGHMVISRIEDIEKFEIPTNLSSHPKFIEEVACIAGLKEAVGGRVPVLSNVVGSLTLPSLLMGMAKWIDLFFNGPYELRDAILLKCSEFVRWRIGALREAGADLISYSNAFASMNFLRPQQFEKRALPWILKDFFELGTKGIVYFNAGGRINPSIPELIDPAGLSAFYINPFDNIREAKQMVAGGGLVVSSINDIKLVNWSEEEIDTQVRQIMEQGKPGGGFLFGTLLMPMLIPQKKIEYMIESAKRHGNYDA